MGALDALIVLGRGGYRVVPLLGNVLRRGTWALVALERSVGLSEDRRRGGERLLRAAELAFQTGRREMARRLLTEAQNLDLSVAERQRIVFMRQWFVEELPSGDSGVRASVEAAERAGRSGDGSTATNLLLNAVWRAFAAGAGAEVRQLIVDASTGLNLSHDDPRLVVIRAFAQPIRNGKEVIETLSGISPDGGDGDFTRFLGQAACAVGDFELAVSFLNASVDALRAQGRVALVAMALSARAHAHWHLNRVGTWPRATPKRDVAWPRRRGWQSTQSSRRRSNPGWRRCAARRSGSRPLPGRSSASCCPWA